MGSRWNGLGAAATVIAATMMAMYVWLMRQEGDQPVGWFVGALAVAVALGAFGSAGAIPWRLAALGLCGVILVALGVLGIFSIGLPILIAGVMALIGAARARDRAHG